MGTPLRGWARPRSVAARLAVCEQLIGHEFKNVDLLRQALERREALNRRLAVLGDSIVEAHLAYQWWEKKLTLAQWSELRTSVLCNENLSNVGFRMGLNECILSDPCARPYEKHMMNPMATTVEAVLAAVWLDTDRNTAALEKVINRLGLTHRILDTGTGPPWLYSKITSNRALPRSFFSGHHLALIKALSESRQHQEAWVVGHGKPVLKEAGRKLVTNPDTSASEDKKPEINENVESLDVPDVAVNDTSQGNDQSASGGGALTSEDIGPGAGDIDRLRVQDLNFNTQCGTGTDGDAISKKGSAEDIHSVQGACPPEGGPEIDFGPRDDETIKEQEMVDRMRALQRRIRKLRKKQDEDFNYYRGEALIKAMAELEVLKEEKTGIESWVDTGSNPTGQAVRSTHDKE